MSKDWQLFIHHTREWRHHIDHEVFSCLHPFYLEVFYFLHHHQVSFLQVFFHHWNHILVCSFHHSEVLSYILLYSCPALEFFCYCYSMTLLWHPRGLLPCSCEMTGHFQLARVEGAWNLLFLSLHLEVCL